MSASSVAKGLSAELRFGARTLAFAGYSVGTYLAYTANADPVGSDADEARMKKTMRRFGRHMMKLFGVSLVARNLPPEGYVPSADARGLGRIFALNHRSGLDILVSLATLEGRQVSRGDLAKWPVIGLVARRAGILFVDRENRRSAAAVMQAMIEQVKRGNGVVIFPEGTTYPGDEVRELKPGAFTVARRTGCEIVPVGLAYAGEGAAYLENDTFVEHMRRVAGRPKTRVAMVIGAPLSAEGADSQELGVRARAAIQELVHEARAML